MAIPWPRVPVRCFLCEKITFQPLLTIPYVAFFEHRIRSSFLTGTFWEYGRRFWSIARFTRGTESRAICEGA